MNNQEINDMVDSYFNEVEPEVKCYHASKKENWIVNGNSTGNTLCAKSVKSSENGDVRFFVKRCGCEFFDPTYVSPIYGNRFWKMSPVSKVAFELYIAFLGFGDGTGKGKQYLKTKGERLV